MFSKTVSEKIHNEDAIYASDHLWIVADGASALLGGDHMKTGSDAAWLSHSITESASAFNQTERPVQDILRSVLLDLARSFPQAGDEEMPSCSIAIVRLSRADNRFEVFVLGDCSVLMQTEDHGSRICRFCDPAVGKLDHKVIERMRELSVSLQSPFPLMRRQPEIRQMLIENRALKNRKPDGYSIADLHAEWFSCIEQSFPAESVSAFALYSDGFDQLQQFLHLSDEEFAARLFSDPEKMMDQLWQLQEDDEQLQALPRLKKRDDTSLIVWKRESQSV